MAVMPELALTQSINLDFLDDLPDIPEYVPVDMFFEDYIEELEHQGQNMVGSDGGPSGDSEGLLNTANGATSGTPPLPDFLPGQALPMVTDQQSPATSAMLPAEQAQVHVDAAAGVSPSVSQAVEMPAIPAPTARTGRGGRQTRGRQTSSRNNDSVDSDYVPVHEPKIKRNPRQQLQNKQAQARYRDRRKQRFAEMEQTIDALSSQVQDAQRAAEQATQLQGKNSQLEQALQAKESEIERLKAELMRRDSGSSGNHNNMEHGSGDVGSEAGEEGAAEVGKAVTACQTAFEERVLKIKAFVAENHLYSADVNGVGVAPEVLGQLSNLVCSGASACHKAVVSGGVSVLDLMGAKLGKMTHIECQVERAKWLRILAALRLTPQQQEQILVLRTQHLAKLRDIYEQRQALNLQAMGLMLPHPSKRDHIGDPSLEGKMQCMTVNGYLYCARNNVELNKVLDAIKDNLRQEQKTVMELSFLVNKRVLTPIQCALFMMESFPAHTDCLALANICALQRDDVTLPEQLGPCGRMLADVAREAAAGADTKPAEAAGGAPDFVHDSDSHKSDSCTLSGSCLAPSPP